MSDYTRNQIKEFAVSAISNILPLDNDALTQMVEYVLNSLHTREEVYKYFSELIGEDPDCIELISKLQSMMFGNDVVVEKKKSKKIVPTPSKKQYQYVAPVATKPKVNNVWEKETKKAEPKPTNNQRLSKEANSTTISELIDKKPATQKKNGTSKGSKKRTLKNLQDVESALAQLEIGDTRESTGIRRCNCMGTRHPVFEFYPNCLNCGKIICSKEGLQPCSFCGKELLSEKEKLEILNVLTMEKMDLEAKTSTSGRQSPVDPIKNKKKEKITISLNAAGEHNLRKQDAVFRNLERRKEVEARNKLKAEVKEKELKEQEEEMKYFKDIQGTDPELLKAQERLDKLLNFQTTGAERTKIIDRASDFDLPNRSANLWTSPLERALQLKKQQRQLRKQQEAEKERTGRGRKVLDMSIRDGKVILREQVIKKTVGDGSDDDSMLDSEDEEDLETIKKLESEISANKSKEESKKIATYWDYERDKTKWEKPVYLGTAAEENDDLDNEKGPEHASRVQFFDDGAEEEMLVGLPTA